MSEGLNPMVAMVEGVMKRLSEKRHQDESHMKLGGFIDALRDVLDQNKKIVFDNGKSPGEWSSYRGYYEDLQNEPGEVERTVADVLASAQACMGECFEGYKGGDFYMTRGSLLWLGYYGTTSDSRQITGVSEVGKIVIIETRSEPE